MCALWRLAVAVLLRALRHPRGHGGHALLAARRPAPS
jgi:hypothetical protein